MSRCFPYVRRAAGSGIVREGSLLESMKLQKVSEKTPKDSKKDKDKKVKKERSREDHGKASSVGNTSKKRNYDESFLSSSKDCCFVTAVNDTCEPLERSSVTEEHCLPSSLPNPYDSDKSQDSHKRLKAAEAAVSPASHGGNGLRLRLKLSKPAEADKLQGNADAPSFSGRAEAAFSLGSGAVPSNCNATVPLETGNAPCFSGRADAGIDRTSQKQPAADVSGRPPAVHRKQRRAEKMERRYEDLVSKWAPPPPLLLDQPGVEDLSWLSGARAPKPAIPTNSCRISVGVANAAIPAAAAAVAGTLQQRATYLPEINGYAMPYVIPY